jgi:hypothetical protein
LLLRCNKSRGKIKMDTQTLEQSIEKDTGKQDDMSFWNVFNSMIPSIIVGTAASMGCQEVASRVTENPEAVTFSGMVGQYVGSYGAFFPAYLYNNRDRLVTGRKVKWKQYLQEIGSILVSIG